MGAVAHAAIRLFLTSGASVLVKERITAVLIAGTVGLLVGAGLGYGPMLRYKSEGVLGLEMAADEYKRFSEAASDARVVGQFAESTPPTGLEPAEVGDVVRFMTRGSWQLPVAKVSRADMKELPDGVVLPQDRDRGAEEDPFFARKRGGVYLGVRFNYESRDPKRAAAGTVWMASYFRDIALREAIREQLVRWKEDNQRVFDRAQPRKLKLEFEIEQAQSRVRALKQVIAAYPDAAKREGPQVVELRKDNEKFMSPLAQLVASESEIIAGREQIARLTRDLEQQRFVRDLLRQLDAVFPQVGAGKDAAAKLSLLLNERSNQTKTDAEQEKLESMKADLSQITARFLTQSQFISQPSAPTEPIRSPRQIMAISAVLFAFLAALWAWRDALFKLLDPKPNAGRKLS